MHIAKGHSEAIGFFTDGCKTIIIGIGTTAQKNLFARLAVKYSKRLCAAGEHNARQQE
jgi:hypothetical protein